MHVTLTCVLFRAKLCTLSVWSPALQVFPQGAVALLFGGFRGEVWMQPGHAAAQGALYRSDSPRHAGVSVVLGWWERSYALVNMAEKTMFSADSHLICRGAWLLLLAIACHCRI